MYNQTNQSTTDPESVLYRKANGKEAKLCFGAHLLMENRQGLCAELSIHNPIDQPEPAMAIEQLDEHVWLHAGTALKTVGADKNYHQKDFVRGCRARRISPHVACKDGIKTDWTGALWARSVTRSASAFASESKKSSVG